MIAFADSSSRSRSTQAQGRSIGELLETVSASRLNTWLQCRLKFYFRYVSGIAKPPTAALHVGKAVHAVLQQWSLARWRGLPWDDSRKDAALAEAWETLDAALIDWNGEQELHRAQAFGLVETYLRDTPIPHEEKPEGVEVSVEKNLSAHRLPTLVGIIDLVRSPGRIVDFKTSGRTPAPEMVPHTTEIQTTGYALLYREATDCRETAIELHHLIKTKTPKLAVTELPPATEEQFTRLYRVMESYAEGLSREDFVPSPGLTCSSCEFFAECRRWN